tara:strand:- start:957 stop:1634 length:678 start_codon:yes stop_codon:yes gene_type:complete
MSVFACTTAKLVFARKNLPAEISHKIIMLVYHAEHAERRDPHLLSDIRRTGCSRDSGYFPGNAEQIIRETYKCLCCTRHQHSKATIDIATGHPTIAHNPALFTLPLSEYRWHKNNPPPQEDICRCACRHFGRNALRMYYYNKDNCEYVHNRDWRLGLYEAPDDYGHAQEYEAWVALQNQEQEEFEEWAAHEEQQEEAIMMEQAEPEVFDLYNHDEAIAYWGEERP